MGMSRSIIGEGTVALKTRLQCRPGLSAEALIHRSAWNKNSTKFVVAEFYEVQLVGLFPCLPPRRIVSAPVIRALSHTPPAAYPAMTSLKK
jgi:hypothetical protein